MYRISEDMMRDIARDRSDGASWAFLSNMYGIPPQSLKRAYVRKSQEVYGDWRATSVTKNDQGDVTNVYRGTVEGVRLAVTHHSAHRGGCLYIGSVTVMNQDVGATFTFNSTAAPGEISITGARAYAIKHFDKVAG